MVIPAEVRASWSTLARNDAGWREAPLEPVALMDAMLTAARDAADVIRDGATRRRTLVWETKGAADYVTSVDRAAEHVIRARLEPVRGPRGAIPMLGEETWPGDALPPGWCFVVDPLDGTTNFLHGFPPYAVSIGAVCDGIPMAGVVLDAAGDAGYVAVRGGGAFRDGERLTVSSTAEPARALVGTGIPFGGNAPLERYASQLTAVARTTAGIRRAGSAAIDLASVACGALDAFWELHLSPWDIAAGILLVREAGGIVTTPDGAAAPVARGPLVAGNPVMHRWLLGTLAAA